MAYSDYFPSKTQLRADTDANSTGKLSWLGNWVDGTYEANEITRDGYWSMVANKQTTDRPAPQPVGVAERDINGAVFTDVTGPTEVVKMTHHYTMAKNGWIQGLWLKTPDYDSNTITRLVIDNVTKGTTSIVNNPILKSKEWSLISQDNIIANTGDIFDVTFEIYNSANASTIAGGWRISIDTVPVLGEVAVNDALNPTLVSYDYTDLDGTDRTTELQGIAVGSIIDIVETGDSARYVEVEVTSVDTVSNAGYVTYTVITLDSNKGIRDGNISTNTINIPITAPTHYYEIVANRPASNPSWATVTSELFFNEVDQVTTNSAFGIDVLFQEATVSDDWDMMSYSGADTGASPQANIYTYDYIKTSGYTTTLDTFTQVAQLITPSRPKGIYELKMSMTWDYSQITTSAYFRWSTDGGSTWFDFSQEPKDITDTHPKFYSYPIKETDEFVKDIIVEARCGTAGQTLNVPFLDLVYERKA